MVYIGYAELEQEDQFPKLENSLEKNSYPNQKSIIAFLKKGTIELTRMSRHKDVFTGKVIPMEVHIMKDGDFYWSNILAWYVEKHNLRLPKDFEEYILSKTS